MQRLLCEKMVPEARNGGTSVLNNNNDAKDHSRKKLLICLDIFCLFLGMSFTLFYSRYETVWKRMCPSSSANVSLVTSNIQFVYSKLQGKLLPTDGLIWCNCRKVEFCWNTCTKINIMF